LGRGAFENSPKPLKGITEQGPKTASYGAPGVCCVCGNEEGCVRGKPGRKRNPYFGETGRGGHAPKTKERQKKEKRRERLRLSGSRKTKREKSRKRKKKGGGGEGKIWQAIEGIGGGCASRQREKKAPFEKRGEGGNLGSGRHTNLKSLWWPLKHTLSKTRNPGGKEKKKKVREEIPRRAISCPWTVPNRGAKGGKPARKTRRPEHADRRGSHRTLW